MFIYEPNSQKRRFHVKWTKKARKITTSDGVLPECKVTSKKVPIYLIPIIQGYV